MNFILPQSSARIVKCKAEGAAKRKRLLALMPDEFSSSQLALAACITKDAARAQVQKMLHWNDIRETSSYKNPRIYRKVTP